MKSSLALFTLLLVASCAQAQQRHMMPAVASSQGYNNLGFGGGFGTIGGGSAGGALTYQEPGKFPIGFLKNDGDTAVATFMKYEDALALGKKQIAEAELSARGELTPSLGEVARTYRATKVPTLQLQARVTQDNSGHLTVCNLNGNNCHRP